MAALLPSNVHLLSTGNSETSKAYNAYLERNKIRPEQRIKGKSLQLKVISCIMKHIGKSLVERSGGVMIDKLGYFFIWKVPRKIALIKGISKSGAYGEYFTHKSKYVSHSPIFVATSKELDCWGMDNKFSRRLKRDYLIKIEEGHKYKMYLYSLSKHLKAYWHRETNI